MSAFEAYKTYIAIKNHFNKPDYDYIKYNGKTGLKHTSFDKRKDKIFFEKLSKIENVCDFLVANFSIDPKLWIRDLAYSESAQVVYQNWKKRNQSISYLYKSEFKKIMEEPGGHHHPAAIRLYLGGQISLESLCIFVSMTNAIKTWDSKLEYDPVWEDLRMRIVKYTPFIKYEKDKITQIMLDIMSDLGYTK
jgi:hypothetical protein